MKPLAKHILEPVEPQLSKLVFESHISAQTGSIGSAERHPWQWDHVRHLCNRIYYAWNNDAPTDGCVYLAKEQP